MPTIDRDFARACARLTVEVCFASALIVVLAFGFGLLVGNRLNN